jgi:hypothetical protein
MDTHTPDVHEAQPPDVRRVQMVQHNVDLFPRQLESEELKEEAIRGGDNTTSGYTSNPSAHPNLPCQLTTVFLPRFKMSHL